LERERIRSLVLTIFKFEKWLAVLCVGLT